MTNKKPTNPRARQPQAGKQQGGQAPRFTVDQAIAQAQQGRVNVTPQKAMDMAGALYSAGKFAQAEKVCRQTLAARPGNADAHNILGVSLQAQGKGAEAVQQLRRAVELAPTAGNLRANLGEVLRLNAQLEEAAAELEKALEHDSNNAQVLNNLGIVRFEQGRFEEGVGFYRRALKVRPNMAEAFNNLGNALRVSGDMEGAIDAYQGALLHREVYPEAYNNLGTLLQQDGRMEEAEHALRKAMLQNPRYIDAHNNLASLYAAQEKEIDALRILGDTLKFAPRHPATLLLTARIQLRRNNHSAAEQAARLALQEEPESSLALTLLGQVLHETDRYDEALRVLEQAVREAPDNPEALNFYGVALKSVGRLDEARECIIKALTLNGGMFAAYANLNDLLDFSTGEGEELFNHMDAMMSSAANPRTEPFLALHFAYGKALEDRGEHERALEHYIIGGKLKRAQLDYDEADTFAFFDSIREAFPVSVFDDRTYAGVDDERPVFIIGMPRSGSTLVEQIVSSHPSVHGAGEVKYLSQALGQLRDRFPPLPKFPQMMAKLSPPQLDIVAKNYLQALTNGAGDARRVTDKLLTNYFFVGFLHLLYPKAKFVHTVRDPVDTCLSGFTKLFKDDMPHSYDLAELGRYYGKYHELMEHWEEVLPKGVMRTVRYEDVVASTETEAKRLIEFIGLEWNAVCVDFHKSARPVKTASVAQVRKPIYGTSVERWKKYGDGLQPLIAAIGSKPATRK